MRQNLKITTIKHNSNTPGHVASFERFLVLDRLDVTAFENTFSEVII